MSESELDAILNEIRNRGKSNAPKDEVEEALASFSVTKKDDTPFTLSTDTISDPKPTVEPDPPTTEEPTFSLQEATTLPAEELVEKIIEDNIGDIDIADPEETEETAEDAAEETAEDTTEEDIATEDEPLPDAESAVDAFSIDPEEKKDDADFTLGTDDYAEMEIPPEDDTAKPKNKKKIIIIAIVAVIAVIAIGVGVYFGVFAKDKTPQDTPTAPVVTDTEEEEIPAPVGDQITNPLTGEAGYSASALKQRPVAVVVENEYSSKGVRPQWGLDEADIVLEGEAEFSTRTLLFWADYNNVPKQVGPTRSARPPFIRFSQLFNAVFIHAGLSRSKGDYIGADTVFTSENIDHINLLSYSTDGTYMGRDFSRTSTVEHTGYLNGTNCAKLLEHAGINTKLNESKFTRLNFNTEAQDIGTADGTYAYFKWSSNCPDSIEVKYDADSGVYKTDHFDSSRTGETANCKWTNCIFLFDNTTYVVKQNYKHAGQSETYCNYALGGGEGVVLSHGKSVNIKWGVSNGKLWMKDATTNEDITLNPGKSYIGYGSANHGGTIKLVKE